MARSSRTATRAAAAVILVVVLGAILVSALTAKPKAHTTDTDADAE